MIVPYPLQYLCGGKHAGRGTLFVMVLLQLWYLIHIFDRNGGDAIVFSRLPSAYMNRRAMRWNTGKWIGKGRNHIHINGKKFAGEQDRSLFPGAGRLTSECSEHPHKALMGSSAVSAC